MKCDISQVNIIGSYVYCGAVDRDTVDLADAPPTDRLPQVAKYVADFHPRLVGLTGDYNTIKQTCKAYRVYFSTPPNAKAEDDYLVDHSIFFYFMDPNGQFVDAFGKASSEADVVERVKKEMGARSKLLVAAMTLKRTVSFAGAVRPAGLQSEDHSR